jgi:hypothetical protein
MKLLKSTLVILLAVACFMPMVAQAEPIGVDAGIQYNSDYFWRGFSFYGYGDTEGDATRGVFFPWVGYGFSDFYLYIGGEIAESLMAGDDVKPMEREWEGIDFILTYSKGILDDNVTLGMKLSYFYYPRSRDLGNKDWNDFAEVAPSITFSKLPLSPKFLVSWYYRPDEQYGDQENAKDFYYKLSLGHTFNLTDSATLHLGAWGAYFWYASFPVTYDSGDQRARRGFSDVGALAKVSVTATSGVSFSSSYNFAYSPDDDFAKANTYNDRYHHWLTFGVTYSL